MIMVGDNVAMLRERVDDESVALAVTSPPYDDLRDYKGKPSWNFDALRKELRRVLVPGGVVAWVTGDRIRNGSRMLIPEKQSLAFQADGWTMHDIVAWCKPYVPMHRHGAHQQCWETVIVASKGKPRVSNPEQVPCSKAGTLQRGGAMVYRGKAGEQRPREKGGITPATKRDGNWWVFHTGGPHTTTDAYAYAHPATFPERLAAKIIKAWSQEGDVVLDPFAGSGTTLKMARLLNRKWLGIEISAEYAAIAERRVNEAVSLFDNGETE